MYTKDWTKCQANGLWSAVDRDRLIIIIPIPLWVYKKYPIRKHHIHRYMMFSYYSSLYLSSSIIKTTYINEVGETCLLNTHFLIPCLYEKTTPIQFVISIVSNNFLKIVFACFYMLIYMAGILNLILTYKLCYCEGTDILFL